MNLFAQQLRTFISKKNASIAQMAVFCGIDRSTMYKIVHGTRKPGSDELVRQAALFLKLSPEETAALFEKYQILLTGEENYLRQKDLLTFLRACFDEVRPPESVLSRERFSVSLTDDRAPSRMLHGCETVHFMCSLIIEREMQRKNGLLRIFAQPNDRFSDLLLEMYSYQQPGNPLRIQHIMALDGTDISEEQSGVNLGLLRAVLPVCQAYPGYNLYYYHANLHTDRLSFSFFPNIIITGEYAMQISGDRRFAILHSFPEAVTLCTDMFSNLMAACIRTTLPVKDYRNLLYYGKNRNGGREPILFEMYPCMSCCLTEDLLDRYILPEVPERGMILRGCLEVCLQDREAVTAAPATILVSEHGLRTFLKSGRLPEYPTGLYTPLLPQDRALLLRRYLDIAQQSSVNFRIIRETFGNTSSETSIWIEDGCAHILFSDAEENRKYLFIRDSGILTSLRRFFQNLPAEFFMAKEESLAVLRQLLQEAQQAGPASV